MKRPVRIVLAIILIIFLYVLWMGLGSALFGWRHGGGVIPTMLFFALSAFLWRTITKKTPEEKGEVQNNAIVNIQKNEEHDK
jgi:CHASE2 domain-containing sensor protein